MQKKIAIVYCVTLNHYYNFKKIKDKLEFDIYYVFENYDNFKIIDNTISIDHIEDFLIKFKNNFVICIFSTCQLRKNPMRILYIMLKNNIKTIAIQETNQMFLHNGRMNNYILPMNYYLLNSQYEKEKFKDYNYDSKNLIATGWPYFKKHTKNVKNKKVIIILNASNITNPISLETTIIQEKILQKINITKNVNYNFYVKFHPSENIHYVRKLKNKFKQINFLPLENKEENFLDSFEYVFLTGYTQLLLESINLKKKLIIIDVVQNSDLIKKFKLNSIKINELEKSINLENKIINNDIQNLMNINLNINPDIAKNRVINFINNNISNSVIDNELNMSELYIWFRNFNYSENYELKKHNNYEIKIILNKNYNFKNNRKILNDLLTKYQNHKIYLSLIIFLIKNLVKYNIYPNKDEFNHIISTKYDFIINYFYWDLFNFSNLLYSSYKLDNYINFHQKMKHYFKSFHIIHNKKMKFIIFLKNTYIINKFTLFRKIYYLLFNFLTTFRP